MTFGSLWHSPSLGDDQWVFIVARSFIATINSGASPGVVRALWSHSTDAELPIEKIVGELPLGGGGVHSFAIVSLAGESSAVATERSISVVVRGAAVVDVFSVGGARRFGAGSVEPWMLADFSSVTSVVLCGDDQPTEPVPRTRSTALPIAAGVVRGERLLWSLRPVEFAEPVAIVAEPVAIDAEPAAISAEATILSSPRGAPAHAAGGPEDETIPIPRPSRESSRPADSNVTAPESGRRRAAVPFDGQPPLTPAPRAPHARFGFTIAGSPPRLLEGPTILGRNPSAPRLTTGPTPVLITVDSPDGSVSSSHLRIAQEGEAVVVTDLRSTNGTLLSPPGGRRRRLRAGEALVVLVETVIDIGDGNIIEITSADRLPEPSRLDVTIAEGSE